jgi:O-methyltransferase involved in polyketide biosynthesis
MLNFAQRWRDQGLDVDLSDLWYHGDRNDVAKYLDTRGWRSIGTTMQHLLVVNGLPPVPDDEEGGASVADNVYYTSILA